MVSSKRALQVVHDAVGYRIEISTKSIPLRGPVPSTSRVSGPSAPGPATDSAREPSRAGCILFSDGDRSTNGTRFRDISSELQEIRMRYDPVRDVDNEIVGGIASTPLRQENKIPRSIVAGSRDCVSSKGQENSGCENALTDLFHL